MVLYVTRIINISISYLVLRVISPQRMDVCSASGECQTKTNIIRKPPSCISLPARNVNPALSLTSPLIFASFLIEQGLQGQAALLLDQLETPERARPLPLSTCVPAAQSCPDLLRYPAERQVSIHLNRACRLFASIHPPHNKWSDSLQFNTSTALIACVLQL